MCVCVCVCGGGGGGGGGGRALIDSGTDLGFSMGGGCFNS